MSGRLHMVAKKITVWKEKSNSSALDNFKTAEAGVKWTRSEVLYLTPSSRIVKTYSP